MVPVAPSKGAEAPAAHETGALATTALAERAASDGLRAPARLAGRELIVSLDLPAGAPVDPELSVVAVPQRALQNRRADELLEDLRSAPATSDSVRRAPVQASTASLSLPDTWEGARLLVDGRFYYLERPTRLQAGQTEVQLTPQLGACLVVRLDAPSDADMAGELSLLGGDFSGRSREGFERREREIPESGELVFRALKPELTWNLTPELEALHGYTEMGIELQAGRERSLELELTPGATVVGDVLDEQGRPRVEVEVRATGGMPWFGGAGARSTQTDEGGRFELVALAPGDVQIEAVDEGWVTAQSETFELADGERAEGVHLTMSQGLAIAGRVLGEDGQPAADTVVTVETSQSRGGWGGWGGTRRRGVGADTTDSDGRFRVTGLDEGKFTVRAEREVGREGGEVRSRAAQDAVPAGSKGLLLTLAGPLLFEGRVIDDRGEPVTAFEIVVEAIRDGGPRERSKFKNESGEFVFARVGPGEWEVSARAEGHAESAPQTIHLPAQDEVVELTLERHALVSGQVLDPNGTPAAGATLRADDGTSGGNPWAGPRGPRTETDAEGRFELSELRPGGLALVASREGSADSEELGLELAPGERREELMLSLRMGGRIVGSVVTAEGDPRPDRRVTWGSNAMGFGSRGETTTDASGHFTFEHVTPGEWAVSAAPSLSEMGRSMRGKSGQSAFVEAMGDLVSETVTVVDGQVVEVFLGGEPKRPVRVFGVVSRGGEPVSGAQVYAVAEGKAVFQGMKTSVTDADGSYELTVDRPGPYSISANSEQIGVEVMVDVVRAEQMQVDLLIPLGGIQGTVRAPSGEQAEGVRLSIQREDGLGRMRWAGSQATTDADGAYSFDDLEAGRYTVRANVSGWGGPGGSVETGWGNEVIGGIEVEKDRVTAGIDFELEGAGGVKGLVRDPDGAPAAGVTIFFRDEEGHIVSSISGTNTNAAGRFEQTGLAPGNYTLSARAEGFAASEATTVRVQSGEMAETEFEVEVGTTLLVTFEDGEGELQRARIEVLDGNGTEVGGMMSIQAMQSIFNEGASSREQRVGPLPPGRYTVRATTPEGESQERRVSLRGRETEKAVKLRLKD